VRASAWLLAAALAASGCAADPHGRGTAQQAADELLAARVKLNLLKDRSLGAMEIGVHALGGRIELRGSVATEDERTLAAHIARGTPGVQSVLNSLKVR
jgi:osmotically-inducible protein OsmY